MRRGEVFGLRREDVDSRPRVVPVVASAVQGWSAAQVTQDASRPSPDQVCLLSCLIGPKSITSTRTDFRGGDRLLAEDSRPESPLPSIQLTMLTTTHRLTTAVKKIHSSRLEWTRGL